MLEATAFEVDKLTWKRFFAVMTNPLSRSTFSIAETWPFLTASGLIMHRVVCKLPASDISAKSRSPALPLRYVHSASMSPGEASFVSALCLCNLSSYSYVAVEGAGGRAGAVEVDQRQGWVPCPSPSVPTRFAPIDARTSAWRERKQAGPPRGTPLVGPGGPS